MIKIKMGVELNRIERDFLIAFTGSIYNLSERPIVARKRIVLSQPHVRILDDALQGFVILERAPVCFKRFCDIMEVQLAVLCSNPLIFSLSWAHLPVHLAMNAIYPWHSVPGPRLVDCFVLIGVSDARERKLVVDCADAVGKLSVQLSCDRNIMKRLSIACEE